MLIIGARGFAKELLEVFHQLGNLDNLTFYDDVTPDAPDFLFGKFPIIKTFDNANTFLNTIDPRFALGIGKPVLRYKIANRFSSIGGKISTIISPDAKIGSYNVLIEEGSTILSGATISNDVVIGKGVLIYYNSCITHDCVIGDFVEVSPSATILGRDTIGSFTHIGSNSTILPDVKIGKNVIVAAGSVVTKDVPDNCMVAGIPAVVKKQLEPLNF